MTLSDDAFKPWEGHIVPRTFIPSFVVWSYVVAFFGASSTLELLNRRTSRKGRSNHLLLFGAAVTMGGISIWSMHFIGNRAIMMADGQNELQIAYSIRFTVCSFFLPIIVLTVAFVAIGARNQVSWLRICGGGTLAGVSMCGMHYLGNASISNYTVIYNPLNVVGSGIIAVFASIVALSLFFASRASWTNTWWKRVLSALVLAGAVNGMHWCATTGTNYRLHHLNPSPGNFRDVPVVVVIINSIIAAVVILGIALYSTCVRRRYASKARQVVLAAAIFDDTGRILVNTDGLLPCEKITDAYVERTPSDMFSTANPLFQWMFQASRNWASVSLLIGSITEHLASLPRYGPANSNLLVSDDGQLVEHHDMLFRELFCQAAAMLADRLKEQLVNVGILWDEILPTGVKGRGNSQRTRGVSDLEAAKQSMSDIASDKEEAWFKQPGLGRGSLMFLVRHLRDSHDVARLEAAGFRFADVRQVCGIIGSHMQIEVRDLPGKFRNMANFAEDNSMMEPGVHVGFFGVKARVGGFGFDVLARKGASNLLPSMQMGMEQLEPWQLELIHQFEGARAPEVLKSLSNPPRKLTTREAHFASRLASSIQALRASIADPIFNEAVLTKVAQVPCRARAGTNTLDLCSMLMFRLMIPIHTVITSTQCEFVPLSLFRVRQTLYQSSTQCAAFSQQMHRELSPIIREALRAAQPSPNSERRAGRGSYMLSSLRCKLSQLSSKSKPTYATDADGNAIPVELGAKMSSIDSTASLTSPKHWKSKHHKAKASAHDSLADVMGRQPSPSPTGGILVSQEIEVHVGRVDDDTESGSHNFHWSDPTQLHQIASDTGAKKSVDAAVEMQLYPPEKGSVRADAARANAAVVFIDELFSECVGGR
ncbi:hypothetical protein F4780DRAFT_64557 [Xylariomycetidae sp. FL0641]|nr:hypothetical protein F4780DRAFT_64557 [Xylariomycetidae sp. FL0641]